MNLLDRIDAFLADTRARIHPGDFEECATSLLSPFHPGLVPIVGGTDFGLDGEVSHDGRLTGLVVTSSRSWKGAVASVRGSLDSARAHGLPVERVVVANLAEVDRLKREKLRALVAGFACELVEVYDRVFFANQFRAHPDWRLRVLAIAGDPFSFSREPRGARPGERFLSTVGRDELLGDLGAGVSDVVLFGVPGSGKSHVASKLGGVLFLERGPVAGRLVDDVIAAAPDVVVVDDAGGRGADLEVLLRVRRAEGFGFRVVATCWPHEVDHVGDLLPDAERFEVGLLTREELGVLLRERGVTNPPVIWRILGQADGRPGWALNLADLLIHQDDWRSVWSGQALRKQIFAFLRRSRAAADAVDVLGVLALLGRVDEDQLRRMADVLQMRRPDLVRLVKSVAVAGLVDVVEVVSHDRETSSTVRGEVFRVQPELIAASIAAEVFFDDGLAPVSVREVSDAFPDLRVDILLAQIRAKLLGATHPLVPSRAEVIEALPAAKAAGRDVELLEMFGLLGPDEAQFVVGVEVARVLAAVEVDSQTQAGGSAKNLAARVSQALEGGAPDAVLAFVRVLDLLDAKGWDIQSPAQTLVRAVRGGHNGEHPVFENLLGLAEAMTAVGVDGMSDAVWAALVREILTPTFDANFMNPEVVRQMLLHTYTWAGPQLAALFAAIEPGLVLRAPGFTPTVQFEVLTIVEMWVRVANGYPLPFNGQTTPEQEQAAGQVVRSIATVLAPTITTRGVRAKFNKVAKPLDMNLEETDELFAALTEERERVRDWQEARQRREAALDAALAPFQAQDPAVLMKWLEENEADLAIVQNATPGAWQVFSRLAYQPVPDPEVWLEAAVEHGFAGNAISLVEQCVRNDTLTAVMTNKLLADPNGRTGVIAAVLRPDANPDLVPVVVADLTVDDISALESAYAFKDAPAHTRHALFTHPVPKVRSFAAAQWAAEWAYDDEPLPDDPEWLNAMADYTVPGGSRHDHTQSQALKALVAVSPAAFGDLMVKHAENVASEAGYDDFDEWEESVKALTGSDRLSLWNRVRKTPFAKELFWVIAGHDADWIADAVSAPDFTLSLRQLLGAFRLQAGERFDLGTLARMLKPLSPTEDQLLATLDYGSFNGEEHERYAARLDMLRKLADDKDPELASLGKRGVKTYEPLLKEALAKARLEAVRGHGF